MSQAYSSTRREARSLDKSKNSKSGAMAGFLYSSPASSCNCSFCSRSDSPASIHTCPRALHSPRHVPEHCPPSTDPSHRSIHRRALPFGPGPLDRHRGPSPIPPLRPSRPRDHAPEADPVTAARGRPKARPHTSVAQFPAPKINLHFAPSFLDASRGGRCALSSSIRGPVTGIEGRVLERIVKAHSSRVNLHQSPSISIHLHPSPIPQEPPPAQIISKEAPVCTKRGRDFPRLVLPR